ncbi:MAG: YhcH/YjgK/YiaL family protein [Synergistaceae bacterium]|nr:YhcH/YjgK/YiaL family protein [Synergistaceae bacterium]
MFHTQLSIASKYDYIADKLKAGLKWLAETDIAAIADGKYRVLGDDVIADVQTYNTQPVEARRFEAHDKFFDVQYVFEGEEFFGVCSRDGLSITEAHPERDTYFLEAPDKYSMVLLKAGEFIVVPPEDAHMPKCSVNTPARVRKVVLKVRV